MENFFGIPNVNLLLLATLTLAAAFTTFLGTVTGTAGGLLLLAIMTFFFPIAILIPIHTVVQLGASISRTLMMWPHVKKSLIAPFAIGACVGAYAGAQIFCNATFGNFARYFGCFHPSRYVDATARNGGAREIAVWFPRLRVYIPWHFCQCDGNVFIAFCRVCLQKPARPRLHDGNAHGYNPCRQAHRLWSHWPWYRCLLTPYRVYDFWRCDWKLDWPTYVKSYARAVISEAISGPANAARDTTSF